MAERTLPKYITPDAVHIMLDHAKSVNKRDYLVLLTLWQTGLRCSELTHLERKDVIDGVVIVRNGKGHKDRSVPLSKELEVILGFYMDTFTPSQRLFDLSERTVRNITYKYAPDGVSVHPHTLRHSFAVNCLKNCMNLRNLQRVMGHARLDTTEVYLDLTADDLKQDFDKVRF